MRWSLLLLGLLPGAMAQGLYAHTQAGLLAPAVQGVPERVYVPNEKSHTVTVIDPKTYRILTTFPVPSYPEHVVPSWDLKTLYVASEGGNALVPIDPKTGRPGRPIPVADPYNLYFTPDGAHALVVAENRRELRYHDPRTFRLQARLKVPCRGVNHLDFSEDGRYFLAACEWSGDLLKVRTEPLGLLGKLHVGGMPQDVRLADDGRTFYVAEGHRGGVLRVDGEALRLLGFTPTGRGAHGLYPSRDGKRFYVSNRDEGSVSVLDMATGRSLAKWRIPGGGSPDMGGVSADGKTLWLSGRYHKEVYVWDTATGKLLKRIPVGDHPHGLAYFPQPGRYALGHTGNYR
ncbi:YncE family protein [Thermus islandicus]|uniref:YncE family protein n=1 Tax=Thermus islandicus TaxID=540988 RepID=UPI0003B376EB|nr:hypothetical protein [Thermus islandicus]